MPCLSFTSSAAGKVDIDFLSWLTSTVSQAAKAAEEHQALQLTVQALITAIEGQFKLTRIQVSMVSPLNLTSGCSHWRMGMLS